MQQPKFKVGEVVIRQAPNTNYPEANGEYVVLGIVSRQEADNIGGVTFDTSCKWFYKLPVSVTLNNGRSFTYYSEEFLYKKHQPGEMSFNSLMEWMKQPTSA